jgi:glucosamine-6-phosphate deaminase
MEIYRISHEDMLKWCSLPAGQLVGHPESKVDLHILKNRPATMELAGNMMADEVKKNNAEGRITKWVLGSGPEDQFQYFINRVNTERISLKNLYIFHMDYGIDWNSRVYPEGNNYNSPQGRMKVRFYGKIDPELNVPEEQRIWPTLQDLDYVDNKIEELGGIDTLWAGIGYKGLVAFCESPNNPYQRVTEEMYVNMKTKVVQVSPEKVVEGSQRVFGGCYDMMCHQAVTIGMKSMLTAKRAVCMIPTGEWKQTVLRVLMFSDATLEYPCTLLPKYIPEVVVLTDQFTATHPMSLDEIPLSNENQNR